MHVACLVLWAGSTAVVMAALCAGHGRWQNQLHDTCSIAPSFLKGESSIAVFLDA